MINSISSFLSFYSWLCIFFCCLILAIQPLLVRFMPIKSWIAILCAVITILSGACVIQRYTSAKELAYPMNFFDSYEDIQSHENFNYKITVYDEKDSKEVRVYDKENVLTFDFIVKNNPEATTECVKASFEH